MHLAKIVMVQLKYLLNVRPYQMLMIWFTEIIFQIIVILVLLFIFIEVQHRLVHAQSLLLFKEHRHIF